MAEIDGGMQNEQEQQRVYPYQTLEWFSKAAELRSRITEKSISNDISRSIKASLNNENISKVIISLDRSLNEVFSNASEMKDALGIEKLDVYIEQLLTEVSKENWQQLAYQQLVDNKIYSNHLRENKSLTRDLIVPHSVETAILTNLLGLEVNRYSLSKGGDLIYCREDFKNNTKSALLHDIGKIFCNMVDLWTLSRQLTDEERPVIRMHAELGYEILKGKVPEEIAQLVRYSHEKYNGSGYYGKKGDEITKHEALLGTADRGGAMNTGIRKYRDKAVANLCNALLGELYGYEMENGTPVIYLPSDYPNDNFGRCYMAYRKLFKNGFEEDPKDKFYKIEKRRMN
jgi:HD-GYP domain-containing protein (c-di-GMP phosphodiesterase class II)